MATIQEATKNSIAFAQELLGPDRAKGLQLEEVESGSQDGKDVWRVTLSMASSEPLNNLVAALGAFRQREYKTFTVLKDTGEVTSMKIRETAKLNA
jgi:hypothetical protein